MKQCSRCASEIGNKDKVCPRCGLPTDRMEFAKELEEEAKSSKLNRAQKKEKRRLAKLEKKEAKRQKKLAREISLRFLTFKGSVSFVDSLYACLLISQKGHLYPNLSWSISAFLERQMYVL